MRKTKRLVVGLAVAGMCGAPGAQAQNAPKVEPAQNGVAAMPLHDVVLFSSGVGYFGRTGRVSGESNIELSFPPGQINDILKSLVLFDTAGTVRPVTYSIADYVASRPLPGDISINSSNSLGTLLRQFQGTQARLETRSEPVEGRIVSVSTKTITLKEGGTVQNEIVNVLTATGLRMVSLDDVTQVRLLDATLDRALRASLEKIASSLTGESDKGNRPVRLHFFGNSTREVRAGYLTETPVWKTSYRLVLDPKGKPYLQGWAQVENTTDEDWTNVHLSLVSGRPISFIQDLYQPLYVARPVVAPQIIGSPLPQTYAETLENRDQASPRLATSESLLHRNGTANYINGPAASTAPGGGGFGGGGAFGGAGFSNSGNFAPAAADEAASAAGERQAIGASAEQLAKSVAAQATGTERGELFEYAIGQPVSLPRKQAAMVPIVSNVIDGDKLSIYDPTSGGRALNGFRLRNNTGLHLSGGPITVFQNGVYAGDGQINNVQPGETRLISYAVDLDLVAASETPNLNQQTLSIVAQSGVLQVTLKERRERSYTFRNKSETAKKVLVQQAIDTDYKLVTPKEPDEKSPTEYRFVIDVPGKKSATLKVVEERPILQTIALVDMDFNLLVSYARNTQVSPKLRGALEQLVARRRKITDLQKQRADLENELKAISQEQDRIRQNMAQLSRDDTLYKRYVTKLNDQETRIEKLRGDIARLVEAEHVAQTEMRTFVGGITLD